MSNKRPTMIELMAEVRLRANQAFSQQQEFIRWSQELYRQCAKQDEQLDKMISIMRLMLKRVDRIDRQLQAMPSYQVTREFNETQEEMSLRHAIERKAVKKVCEKCGQNPYDGHYLCSGRWDLRPSPLTNSQLKELQQFWRDTKED